VSYFSKILVANRGEIACRVFRACRALGIRTVAVFSEADRGALHLREADEAYLLGPAPAAESYLHVERVVAAALRSGAEAVHPGYGFLSERAAFAEAVVQAGLVFIGPSPEAIARMGDKVAARAIAQQAEVPVVPGYDGPEQSAERLLAEAARIGFPLLIKASAGGGGRGMRVVRERGELELALEGARREAQAAFGDGGVFLERRLERPRHVEIQVFADGSGATLYLGERECSIQRRHQKIVEEAPSPALNTALRAAMGEAAVRVARAVGYVGAGTVEFLLDEQGRFFFLEMNTRLQVEHPVSEALTGLDLVQLQIAVAAGESLPLRQADLRLDGHAIEVRLYAEHPQTYLPAAGPIKTLHFPATARVDAGYAQGDQVGTHYDPLLAKLIVHGRDRADAIRQLDAALAATHIAPLTTNLPLLRAIVASPAFAAGATTTDFLERETLELDPLPPVEALIAAAAFELSRAGMLGGPLPAEPWQAGPWRLGRAALPLRYRVGPREVTLLATQDQGERWRFVYEGREQQVALRTPHATTIMVDLGETSFPARVWREASALLVEWAGRVYRLDPAMPPTAEAHTGAGAEPGGHDLVAPMPGTVRRLLVAEGQAVVLNEPLLVLEAMKMEHTVASPYAGVVARLLVAEGQLVAGGTPLVELVEP
jgi:3-methylcrotonyl-CoA carboxylase alpha subunit